jgi:hypothetical protein
MRCFAIVAAAGALLFCLVFVLMHKAGVEPVVARFHESYNSGQFDAIWDAAHPSKRSKFQSRDLQNAFKTKEDFKNYLRSAQSRHGKVISSSRLSMDHIDSLSWTEKLAVVQRTVFEKGVGTESFVFEIIDHEPVLVGYELR